MHMNGSSTSWRSVVVAADRFHWLLGIRVALAFVGPVIVAHVAGRWEQDAPIVAIAALLVALVGGALPAGRTRRRYGPALVAALPAAAVLAWSMPTYSVAGVAMLVAAALVAGLAPLRSPATGAVASAFALSLIVLAHVPSSAHTALLLLAGGALAMGLVVATDALQHPKLGLPRLPSPAVITVAPHERRRHAMRLALTLALAAGVAAVVGTGTTFAAHSSWMLLGVWIALQPHATITRHVALQRAAGTALGAVVTLLVVVAVPHGLWLGWLFLALAFAAFGLRTVNYAWYCVLLTPIVVLGFGDAPLDPQVLLARVAWTAGGVALAVLVRHLLWNRDTDGAPAAVLAVSA
jgi:hypothetical protein